MKIRNTITYTVQDRDGNLVEQTETITRDRKLTHEGARRILRRGNSLVVDVDRVEAMSDGR